VGQAAPGDVQREVAGRLMPADTEGIIMLRRTENPWITIGAAAVHLYTASGVVLAFLIVLAAIQGDALQALWFGLAALVIDSTDGMLARRFRVSETLPWFDGRRLDDIVDYLTFVFAPILLLWSGNYLPGGTSGLVLAFLPLLASSYQFCRVDAKTDDHFFLGFPSYWNIIAFYAIVMRWDPLTVGAMLLLCSLLVFVPIRYLYPSRTVRFRPLTLTIMALWTLSYGLILLGWPTPNPVILSFSLLCVAYYVGLSLYLTYKIYQAGR
jgi:phosphatidylcholine synthase